MTTQTNQASAVAKTPAKELDGRAIEYVAFASDVKIKLTVAIIRNQIASPTKSGRLPSDRDCIKFAMLCQARGLNPWEGDAFLVGYDMRTENGVVPTFSLITAHQVFLKRAEVSKEFDGMQSGLILLNEDGTITEREGDFHLPNETIVGGWAKVYKKAQTYPTYRRLRIERFNTGFAEWKKDPAGMVVKCAESDAMRSAFPTKVGGLYGREEMASAGFIDIPAAPPTEMIEGTAAAQLPQGTQGSPDPDAGSGSGTDGGKPEQAPTQTQQPKQQQPPKLSAKQELEALVIGNDVNGDFNLFQKWCVATGNLPGIDSCATFDEVTEADAKRLLKNRTGLINGLRNVKGQ